MAFEVEARDKGLVAADDHHDQQIGDHHHVDEAEHDQHDLGLVDATECPDQVHQVHELLPELIDIDALRDYQSEIQRQLQPAAGEDQCGNRPQSDGLHRLNHMDCMEPTLLGVRDSNSDSCWSKRDDDAAVRCERVRPNGNQR